MASEDPPKISPEVRDVLRATCTVLVGIGKQLGEMLERGEIPEEPYRDVWHAVEGAWEAMHAAEPGKSGDLGNLPPLPPDRRRRRDPR